MVDVGGKDITQRMARAEARISLRPETLALILSGGVPKGDVLAVARVAGIIAAKRTHDLIPLCHALPISGVTVDFVPDDQQGQLGITATVTVSGRTGVEMEALTAVSVAALTVYDMVKAVDRGAVIQTIRLLSKTGGKSGDYSVD
ncbi:MAG TPA: cyclic pyranopterin monophosphate synthase MoaC [Alphaproteobacteria bacterium]|nr:cyclic pyranopterin monophosphate synthase MoaC [Alphaproteobacteria bacterium]HAJ45386.1 cyclic pyranopterin monophosphate synthase MoaC [Alphaproteobacteria bacterium]